MYLPYSLVKMNSVRPLTKLLTKDLFSIYKKSFVTKINLNEPLIPSCKFSNKLLTNVRVTGINQPILDVWNFKQVRYLTLHHIYKPAPETCRKNLRFRVHYPEDGKYTIEKLPMTKLGGRDPETGRVVFGCVGGGHKRKYRWVQHHRVPVDHDSNTLIERVVCIQYDPNRTAHIALVGQSSKLRFIIATSTMKKGDLILSTKELPSMTIRPKEGNAHPVGALPLGTQICCIESYPGQGGVFMRTAASCATVGRRVRNNVIVRLSTNKDICLDPKCMAVVGKVSNEENASKPIGSPWRLRWLGRRPRSGLFQRKTGRFGRKKRALQTIVPKKRKKPCEVMYLTAHGEGPSRPVIPAVNRRS